MTQQYAFISLAYMAWQRAYLHSQQQSRTILLHSRSTHHHKSRTHSAALMHHEIIGMMQVSHAKEERGQQHCLHRAIPLSGTCSAWKPASLNFSYPVNTPSHGKQETAR